MQWHITDRCNLRCAHCYQESYSGREPSYSDLIHVLGEYRRLLNS